MEKSEIKTIILDQNKERLETPLIEREVYAKARAYQKNPFVIVLSGIRRCGKSTLLNQLKKSRQGYYLNFDDERLINFTIADFQILYETMIEIYGERDVFYFDEIQNIKGWERFVRRLHDEGKKVFVTGSNASMLSKELGTHLTGRYLEIQLFPFSFKEFLAFNNIKIDKNSTHFTADKGKLKKCFEDYLSQGGLPEYLREKNIDYLKTLYESIIYRDIIVRYNLSNEKVLKELVQIAINSISKEISFNSLKKLLGTGSSTTIKEYFHYLENSFLVFLAPRFDFSLKKQIHSNKKVYAIDNGIAMYLGFRISSDFGRLLENLIFIELKRRGKEVYYHSEENECDFLIKESIKIGSVIQVCYEITRENKSREITGLLEAMRKYKLKEGLILTLDQGEEISIQNSKIIVKPAWKWLIE